MITRARLGLMTLAAAWLAARPCAAAAPETSWDGSTAGRFAGGVVAGLLAHEAGHVLANLALGNVPRLEGFLALGFVPFFAVRPYITCGDDLCTKRDGSRFAAGRRGKFAIVTAGFDVQYLGDELIFAGTPDLRHTHAPFRKGMLAFNTLTSLGYAVGAWAGLEDPRGDIANAAEVSHLSHDLLAAFVLLPAVLDGIRYFYPHAAWAPYAAGTSKAALVGLTFGF